VTREQFAQINHKTTKGNKYYPDSLTNAEVEKLIQTARGSGKSISKNRNASLITLLWRTGIRIGEALRLVMADYDRKSQTLRVISTKTKNCRRVGLDNRAVEALENWLKERENLSLKRNAPIYCLTEKNKVGKPLTRTYMNLLLKRLALKSGIEKRLHNHILRATFACSLLQEGFRLNLIQSALNHNKISTTAIYLRSIASSTEIIEAMKARV